MVQQITIEGKKYKLLKRGRNILPNLEMDKVTYRMQRVGAKGVNIVEAEGKEYEIRGLSKDYLPNEEGVYLARGVLGPGYDEIDVYKHPLKGLSCFAPDFGCEGSDVDDTTDCHVSVQNTGLEFLTKIKDLGSKIRI